jgi:hypothetical protein
MNGLEGAFINLFVIVATSSIGMIGAYASMFMSKIKARAQAQTSQIEDESQRKIANDLIDRVDGIVNDTVKTASETLVKDIKASAEDGKLTTEDGQRVFESVKADVLAQIPSKSQALLAETVGDISVYLEKKIETALAGVKAQASAVVEK